MPPDHFVTAWLLLLLDAGVTHGYQLSRELAARGVDVGLPILYRKLRRLERDGFTQSHWAQSAAGPRRRSYRLTEDGRCRLHDATLLVTVLRDQHDAFLHAREQASTGLPGRLGGGPTDQREDP
ncbi:MAG: PadR family transcriptional regulator [Solirubrobacteraceae bacterium]